MRPLSIPFFSGSSRILVLVVLGLMSFGLCVQAQSFTDLHDFGSIANDGVSPSGRPMYFGSSLYGTTVGPGDGAIYKYALRTNTYSILHTFNGADGSVPYGGLFHRPGDASGNQYGCTTGGGNGSGTIFRINVTTGVLTTLYAFSQTSSMGNLHINAEGAAPLSVILNNSGDFYGVCAQGGANGTGTLFKLSAAGVLTVLHTFSALNSNGQNQDGAFSQSGLASGMYGVTPYGGSYGAGVLYHITQSGTFAVLHTFRSNADGSNNGYQPVGTPLVAGGSIYGTTSMGGANALQPGGAIYRYDLTSHTYNQLYVFSEAASGINGDGVAPMAALIHDTSGNLYGTCNGGGASGYGTVFRFNLTSSALTALHTFSGGNTDGIGPVTPLVLVSGALYSTTLAGGSANGGTLFKLVP